MYSQSNEDEIIQEIFAKIGEGGRRFVEFGCGKGNQNNTINLLLNGWKGVWCEPRKKCFNSAVALWEGYPVWILRRVVAPEKVNLIVRDPLDFLSIDIDGNDLNVWRAITAKPRVVCIEYDEVNGSSLDETLAVGEEKGYEFLTVSASEVNAFFVWPT